jgi:hypothetical protein
MVAGVIMTRTMIGGTIMAVTGAMRSIGVEGAVEATEVIPRVTAIAPTGSSSGKIATAGGRAGLLNIVVVVTASVTGRGARRRRASVMFKL